MRRGPWFSAVVAAAFLLVAAGESLAQRGSRGGMSSGSSGRSYGGSSSSRPAPAPRSSAPPASSSGSSGRSYGGSSSPSTSTSTSGSSQVGSGRSYGGSPSGSSTSPTPPASGSSVRPSLGSASTSAQQRAESRLSYQKANGPRDTYTNASGKTVPIDRSNPTQTAENDRLRGQLNSSRMETRSAREDAAYYRWRSQPPMYYNDPFHMNFSSLFLTWALIDQARYMSRHESMMDPARVNQLYAENAALRAEVDKVKKDGVPADYKEPIDPDLAYSNDYVAAVGGYNTVQPVSDGAVAANRPAGNPSTFGGFIKFAFWSVVVASAGYLLYFSIFKYKF